MSKRVTEDILVEVKNLLKKEGELSIRQISIKTGSQWRTIRDALETLASLEIVKERKGDETKREERLFSLK